MRSVSGLFTLQTPYTCGIAAIASSRMYFVLMVVTNIQLNLLFWITLPFFRRKWVSIWWLTQGISHLDAQSNCDMYGFANACQSCKIGLGL